MGAFLRPLIAWIIVAALPLVKKILIGLGIGTIVFAGYKVLVKQLFDSVIRNLQASSVYDLLGLIGFVDAVGIIFAALTIKAGMQAYTKFGLLNK